jgi:hypothetical protein
MKKKIHSFLRFTVVTLLAILATSCASQITTSNSILTTVCETSESEMIGSLREVVVGMKNYKFTAKSQTEALVKYNPSNPIMGSATVQVRASPASGLTKEGKRLSGVEFVYTDVTPLMSQDTSFGGGEIISLLKSSFDELAQFKDIPCTTVRRG